MKKILLPLLFLFVCLFKAWTQVEEIPNEPLKNAVHIELGGAAGYYSVNYEHRILIQAQHRIAAGVGFSYFNILSNVTIGLLSAAYLYGEKHNFELGTSLGYIFNEEFYFVPRIGYRYETSARFLFRAGFSPLFFPKDYNKNIIVPRGYVSVGYIF